MFSKFYSGGAPRNLRFCFTCARRRLSWSLALPSSHRLGTLSQRLDRAQRLLTAPGWQGSRRTRELNAQISDFRVDTATRALHTS